MTIQGPQRDGFLLIFQAVRRARQLVRIVGGRRTVEELVLGEDLAVFRLVVRYRSLPRRLRRNGCGLLRLCCVTQILVSSLTHSAVDFLEGRGGLLEHAVANRPRELLRLLLTVAAERQLRAVIQVRNRVGMAEAVPVKRERAIVIINGQEILAAEIALLGVELRVLHVLANGQVEGRLGPI